MKIITVTNQKGGVAKTTTAAALGFGLALKGFKVLFVDADAQGNLTETTYPVDDDGNLIEEITGGSLFNIMIKEEGYTLKSVIRPSKYPNVDIVPANIMLSEIDMRLITMLSRENILKDALVQVANDYDYCVIDTPPSLGWMTLNALVASDYLIIPTYTERFSLKGIKQLYENITDVKRSVNKKLEILGLLITRNKKTLLSNDLKEILRLSAENMNTSLFNTVIREQVAINEAQMSEKSIYEYMRNIKKRNGTVADDYKNFTEEVLERMEAK